MPQSDMPTSIAIRTIKDLKQAFAIPGVVIWCERNDMQGPLISREPERLRMLSLPRTVKKVQTNSVAFLVEGQTWWLAYPKASDFVADGSNRFSIRCEDRWGGKGTGHGLMTFRLELPGSDGAATPPSPSLAELYPAPSAETLAAEASAQQLAQETAAANRAAREARFDALHARPKPDPDPRYNSLAEALKAAIKDALSKGLFYNDDVDPYVIAAIRDQDFAVDSRLPSLTSLPDDPDDRLIAQLKAKAELARAPRGAHRISSRQVTTGELHEVQISRGNGDVVSAGPYEAIPTWDDLYRRLLGREIYEVRKDIESEMEAEEAAKAHEQIRALVGSTLKNLTIGGQRYSSVEITAVSDAGEVSLALRKRGSSKRWTGTAPATAIARQIQA